jgi:hypothetical protein
MIGGFSVAMLFFSGQPGFSQTNTPYPSIGAISTNVSSGTTLADLSVTPSLPGTMAAPPTSPSPAVNFQALLSNNTYIPPDTIGAVGTNYVVTTLNSQVLIQTRTGTGILTNTLYGFWNSTNLGTITEVFDPRILYDPYSNRWIATAGVEPGTANSGIVIGVSLTSDPTGAWNMRRVKADSNNLQWADHPTTGFNKTWIAVQVNMFLVSSGAWANNSHIYVFNKTNLYAGNFTSPTLLVNTNLNGFEVPVTTYDPNLATLYLVQEVNGNVSGYGYMRILSITGSIGSEVLNNANSPLFVKAAATWADGPATLADSGPQKGNSADIQLDDANIINGVYRNGFIWCAQTIFLPATSPTRAAAQWWQLDPNNGIVQRGVIQDNTGVTNYAYPSISVNKFNDVLVGYSRFSTNQYASADYSFHAYYEAANSMESDVVLKAGEGVYWNLANGTQNRWGDYSGTMVDPLNDNDFWTIQEYAGTPSTPINDQSGRWGTWWGNVQVVVPANDNFSAGLAISGGSGSTNGTNVRATKESGEPNHFGNAGGSSVWYTWTAPANGGVTFSLPVADSTFTTLLGAYTGTSVSALTSVATTPNGFTASFYATSGTTYHIAVDGYQDLTGTFTLTWYQESAPVFTVQPQTQFVIASNSVTFTSLAVGVPTPTYQWMFNNANITGATSTNYTISVPLTNNTGNYSVVGNNSNGSTTSQVARLTVYDSATSTLSTNNYDTNNMFTFVLTGATGIQYVIQASTDLLSWTNLFTNAASFTFTNSVTTNYPYRFFRAVYY